MATDEELFEIGRRAYGIRPADYKGKLEGLAAERRALYEAGQDSRREETKKAFYLGRTAGLKMLRDHEAARIVADRLGAPMSDVEDALAYLHDRITGGGQ